MLKEQLQKFFKIDRRWIFLLLAVTLFVPIMKPLGLPNKTISPATKRVYENLEKLPAGSFVLFSLDYDPSTRPELHPMATALVRHAFSRNLKVGVVTYIAGSTGLIEELFAKVSREYNKVDGQDYVIFPYQPNILAVLTQMSSDLYGIYSKDRNGTPVRDMPVLKGIKSYKDMSVIVCVTGTAILDYWVAYVGDKYRVPVAGGVTAISQPGYGPYLQTNQLKGLIGGMKGAAEYESLIKQPGKGTSGIDALNLAHLLVLALIFTSNILLILIRYL
ncbi:MAG: hypothetical protein A2234_10995 [Elusimicrobia bacterium RIFOXYA2_FULL_58_8]|nr:MAG: hypothetical protein A2285_09965 [Elusimicrobia bacterium RIFOXYA12_FULL_57_11]OGS14544.1 MAG: hypothetical protein A2234_10995 [Elusimicrobia bacterium RIFOXYA2_FULL_58_8]